VKAPAFWSVDDRSLWPIIFSPLAQIYGLGQRIRRLISRPVKIGKPVICIGNLIAGGAGKTPTALAICRLLQQRGMNVQFLSRGYGGRLKGPVRVDSAIHTHLDVGDEPLILAQIAPCWISHDRVAGAKAAENDGADVILMDDGFQNPHLFKNLSLLVVDTGFGFGNGKLMPAGPLREPVNIGLRRAGATILIGKAENFPGSDLIDRRKPVLRGLLIPTDQALKLAGEKVVAFAGIGRPQKFFDSLVEAGCEVAKGIEFPDHYQYNDEDFIDLVDQAATMSAKLVTTRKDYVRLSENHRLMVDVFDVMLHLEATEEIEEFLIKAIS
jgi:tetraacyldisaccharide 4'-kinase